MSVLTAIGLLAGLALLVLGGDALVHGARAIASRLGIPSAVVGSTVVAAGTSLPELVVSVRAALGGSSSIAVGNVVGSNLYNLMLILGGAAVLCPLVAPPSVRRIDLPFLVGSSLALLAALWGGIHRIEGALLLAGAVAYFVVLARQPADDEPPSDANPLWLLPGLVGILAGAELFVTSARTLAEAAGWSERVIGLTVVAIGTSAPELVTSWLAAWRREAGIAIGNVLGSNVFNALAILGTTAVIQPMDAVITPLDAAMLLGATAFVTALLLATGTLHRAAGAALVATSLLYTAALVLT